VNTDPVYNAAAERAYAAKPDGTPRELIDHIYGDVGLTGAAKVEYWTDWVGWWTARSFVGAFGYMDVFLFEGMPQPQADALYRLILALLVIPALVGGVKAWKALDGPSRAVCGAMAVLAVVVAALFVRFNMQYFQGQARYLYPAIGPLALGLALGTSAVLGRHKDKAWLIVAGLLALVQLAAVQAIQAGFADRVR
jgi:hypothetical protein